MERTIKSTTRLVMHRLPHNSEGHQMPVARHGALPIRLAQGRLDAKLINPGRLAFNTESSRWLHVRALKGMRFHRAASGSHQLFQPSLVYDPNTFMLDLNQAFILEVGECAV